MDVPSTQQFSLSTNEALARVREGELARAVSSSDSKEAGVRFEAMLGTMLAREMRRGLDEGFFGTAPGAETFHAWLDDFVGRAMAERGALGTGDLVRAFADRAPVEANENGDTSGDAGGGA
jgi:hypothetical protein